MIYVIGAGTTGELTQSAARAVEKCGKVVVKSNLFSWYKNMESLPHVTLDHIYAKSRNFDTLNKNLVAEVISLSAGADVAYIVDGSGYEDKSVELLLQKKRGKVKIIPSVSKAGLLSHCPSTSYTVFSAYDFAEEVYPEFSLKNPLVIYDADSSFICGDIKLSLFRFYSEQTKVLFSTGEEVSEVSLFEIDRQTNYDHTTSILIPAQDSGSRHTFTSLLNIMHRLRAEDGCAWDREQTHSSIKLNAVEESYELVDAIDSGDAVLMQEESGDVLLQSVFQSKIAEDEGEFDIYDVISGLCNKLIFRHSHIFGSDKAESGADALSVWEKNKGIEKNQKTFTDTLHAVPKAFPAIMRAEKVQKRAAKSGFDFESAADALSKVFEEIAELTEAIKSGTDSDIAGECGDLLFSAVNLLRLLKVPGEAQLNVSTDKFISRFSYMESAANKAGKDLQNCTPAEMEDYYQKAKQQERHSGNFK